MKMRGLQGPTARLRGMTVVELLVTTTVMGIVLAMGVPAFARMIASNRLASQTNELVSGLNLARSEAVRRAQPVALRATGNGIEFASGWRVFTDADGNGDAPSTVTSADGTLLRELGPTSAGTTMRRVTRSGTAGAYVYTEATSSMADRMYVVFNARGGNQSGQAAFFRICDSGSRAARGRIVQVSAVGRISLDSTSEGC